MSNVIISPWGPLFYEFSGSGYQLRSVTSRTNEDFVRLYNHVKEAQRLYFQRSRVLADVQDSEKPPCRQFAVIDFIDGSWELCQKLIIDVDKLMERLEKKIMCSELHIVLAGIMLQFEQILFPALRLFCLHFEDQIWSPSQAWARLLLLEKKYLLQDLVEIFANSVSSGLESAHKLVVSALALLSFVYQYLVGCVDKVGGKTYSPGSFLFRLIFVAIVLFLGSYVWIKSRQASFTANRRKRKLGDQSDGPAGVYRRAVKDSRGEVTHYKYEPRFKPLREKPESGTPLNFNCLPLGSYNTRREAEIVRHLAVVLYGEGEGRPVQFEDGLRIPFPSVTEREKCPPSGKERAVWVTQKTKELYAELLREKARRLQLLHPAVETGSQHGHGGEASGSDPSLSAPVAPSTAFELTCFTSPYGGNGVVEQSTTSESQGVGHGAPAARELFSAFFSDCDFDEVISSMLQREENDSPAMDQIEGDYSATDCVFGSESTPVTPQSSALDNPTSAIFATRPQLGVGDQGLEIIEPHLDSAVAIHFQQLESLPEQGQLQQRATCQETRPEEFPGSNVQLQQKLLEFEERNSKLVERNLALEQKLHQFEVENEKWRSMFRQLAKLI